MHTPTALSRRTHRGRRDQRRLGGGQVGRAGPASAVILALVTDRGRIATIAAPERARAERIIALGGTRPASKAYRDAVRAHLIELAGQGLLEVPVAGTYPLADALEAVERLRGAHPGGKLALLP